MAWCFSLCRKKKKNTNIGDEYTLKKLTDLEMQLDKQQEDIESQISECTEIARTSGPTNKRVAIRALQKKNRLETKLQLIDYTLTTLEQQRDAIEDAKTNQAVLKSIKSAANLLTETCLKIEAHKVQIGINEIRNGIESEITKNVIRKPLAIQGDQDDLEKELNELIKCEFHEMPVESKVTKLPSISKDSDELLGTNGGQQNQITN